MVIAILCIHLYLTISWTIFVFANRETVNLNAFIFDKQLTAYKLLGSVLVFPQLLESLRCCPVICYSDKHLSYLSLATKVTDATLGASGLWLGTQTGAGGTATLA